jgi:translation initiation factor 3 subunit C
MSQFFRPLSSESEDSESEQEQTQTTSKPRWLDQSSDEEEEKRVVRSFRDKRWAVMGDICKNLKNHARIGDFVSLVTDYDRLVAEIVKSKAIVEAEGLPAFFTRNLVRIEDAVAAVSKDEAKKLNTKSSKALNKLKQLIKKDNKLYEAEIEAFRKNPVLSEESSEESEAAEESSSDEWGSGSDSEEAESDDVRDPNNRRAFWELKEEKKEEKPAESMPKIPRKPNKESDSLNLREAPKVEYNSYVILAKLKEIQELRGRRAAVPRTLVESLKEMLEHNTEAELEADILSLLVNFEFESSKNTSVVHMERPLWLDTIAHLERLFQLFKKSPGVFKHGERLTNLRYSLAQFLERLNDELKKALKNVDSQSAEYVERLQDLLVLSSLANQSMEFYETDNLNLARVALLRLEHLHYLHDDFLDTLKRNYSGGETGLYFQVEDSQATVADLSAKVYTSADEKMKLQALLMQVYHHALHSRYLQARELLALRNPSESLLNDTHLQVLFNRTVVQMGLSAFANGLIQDAFNWLNDIVSSYRVDELLAQSVSRKERTPGQERDDRKRQVPYHMQIKSNIVEAVYFICAILLDIPQMAMNPLDPHKHTHSKYLKRVLDSSEKTLLVGPPESVKDYIVAAAESLKQGSWMATCEALMKLDIWRFVPSASVVKERLVKKVKESALITYILSYADAYESFSQAQLSLLFDLPKSEVFSLVSRLISIGQLKASWEGNVIVLDCDAPSKLQFVSNQLTERLTQCTEANEKLMEFRGVFASSLSEVTQRRTNLNRRRRVKKQT